MNCTQYIYLLQEREFVRLNENVYKLGMTKQENLTRFKQYPKGSWLIMQIICNDCTILEREVIKLFTERFILRKDIGNEYFEGDYRSMIDVIYSAIKNEKAECIERCKEVPPQIIVEKEINDTTQPETHTDDNFIAKFVREKIVKDFSGNITKQELNDIFTMWYIKNYDKSAPILKIIHSYMDKQFGVYGNNGAWVGVGFKCDDFVAEFVKEKIITVVGGKITKQELNSEFAIWNMNTYGKGSTNIRELHYYMNKIYRRIGNNGAWLGIRIKYECEDGYHHFDNDDEEQFDDSISI